VGAPKPRGFPSTAALRAWLEAHHADRAELVLRCYKVHARTRGVTYREALDEALCYGWIDGVRRGVDADSFSVRFTPRQAKSRWSLVNTRRALELLAEGRMRPPGRAAFEARDPEDARRYSFETRPTTLAPGMLRALERNARAWAFFVKQPPWYRRTASFWVMSAKRPETRERRFAQLLACSRRGARIGPLTRPADRGPAPSIRPRGRS
jgi:uncharacterized protein YdeI (YjbR/CyaY-like superfamily)